MGNRNRKATLDEEAHATRVIEEAYPGMWPVWGAHGDYGGHRAPRDHTIAFRLQDDRPVTVERDLVVPAQLALMLRAMVGKAGG